MPEPYEHQRPRYHIHPESGRLNDPNGPVLINGRLHLFHQYRQGAGSAVMWGHQSSEDLVHWHAQRPALAPQPGSDDRDGCWSGNAIADDGIVTAFYSGYVASRALQTIVAAESHNGGNSFGRPQRVIPDPAPGDHVTTFRDPFVWRARDEWLMVVGAGDATGRASARLYRSPDLREWHHDGNLAQLSRTTVAGLDSGEMWECPQVIPFGEDLALLVSCWSHRQGTMQVLALTGRAPGARLIDPHYQRYDYGEEFYAASALPSSPWGPVVWGWAREAREEDWSREAGWAGVLTLPRLVAMSPAGQLTSRAPSGLAGLRERTLTSRPMTSLGGIPAQSEIEATIARGPGSAGINIRFSGTELLQMSVDRVNHVVTIDRTAASKDPRATGGTITVPPTAPITGEPLQLSVYLDGSIMEIFTSDGSVATIRIYPLSAPPWILETLGIGEADGMKVHALAAATD